MEHFEYIIKINFFDEFAVAGMSKVWEFTFNKIAKNKAYLMDSFFKNSILYINLLFNNDKDYKEFMDELMDKIQGSSWKLSSYKEAL